MPLPPPFPIRVEDLTVDFLSEALNCNIDRFTTQRIGADRGMLGEIFVLRIEGDGDAPSSLVAKFAALREGSLASGLRGRNYERELLCYEQLLPGTPVRAPAVYGTWYDPSTAHFLLLQDIVAADPDPDQVAGLSIDQARAVLTEVAGLHRRWWKDRGLIERDWLPRLDSDLRIDNLTTLARVGWQPLCDLLGDDMPELPAHFGAMVPSRIEEALGSVASLPHTLLHCDLRADNLLFDPVDGSVTLVDWQGCGVGPAAFDVAYFLVQSLPIADRRAHEAALISFWRDQLGELAHRDDPTAGYDESLWYGLAIACALPVIGDPEQPRVRSLAHAVLSRTVAALADHDQI